MIRRDRKPADAYQGMINRPGRLLLEAGLKPHVAVTVVGDEIRFRAAANR